MTHTDPLCEIADAVLNGKTAGLTRVPLRPEDHETVSIARRKILAELRQFLGGACDLSEMIAISIGERLTNAVMHCDERKFANAWYGKSDAGFLIVIINSCCLGCEPQIGPTDDTDLHHRGEIVDEGLLAEPELCERVESYKSLPAVGTEGYARAVYRIMCS